MGVSHGGINNINHTYNGYRLASIIILGRGSRSAPDAAGGAHAVLTTLLQTTQSLEELHRR